MQPIGVPTTLLHGAEDGAGLVEGSEGQESLFTAGYRREVLSGIGHSIPLEQPEAVIKVLLEA